MNCVPIYRAELFALTRAGCCWVEKEAAGSVKELKVGDPVARSASSK